MVRPTDQEKIAVEKCVLLRVPKRGRAMWGWGAHTGKHQVPWEAERGRAEHRWETAVVFTGRNR